MAAWPDVEITLFGSITILAVVIVSQLENAPLAD
jgi:hypothetical protein